MDDESNYNSNNAFRLNQAKHRELFFENFIGNAP